MLRQNPIQKKRLELNLKRRLLPLELADQRQAAFDDSQQASQQQDATSLNKQPISPDVVETQMAPTFQLSGQSSEPIASPEQLPQSSQAPQITPDSRPSVISPISSQQAVFAVPNYSYNVSSTPVISALPQNAEASVQSNPVQPPSVPVSATPTATTTSSATAGTVKAMGDNEKIAFYQIPAILSAMLSGASGEQITESLKSCLSKAKERNDPYYEAVFEGCLAAEQAPINITRAIDSFQRAFDLSKNSRGSGNGFLQNMVWNLFVKSGGNQAVGKLLDQARTELQNASQSVEKNDGIISRLLGELKQLPGFDDVFNTLKQNADQFLGMLQNRACLPARLATDKTLLFFAGGDYKSSQDVAFHQTVVSKSIGDYLVAFGGRGTVIDPNPGFFDVSYRQGITLGELDNIVLSSADKVEARWFDEAIQSFSLQQSDRIVRVIVAADVAEKFAEKLRQLKQSGRFDIVRFAEKTSNVFEASETELLDGGYVTLHPCSTTLKFASQQGGRTTIVQFLDFSGDRLPNQKDLMQQADIVVFAAEKQDDLFHALANARELCAGDNRPALVVFDVPRDFPQLLGYGGTFKDYLNKTPLAFAASGLVCDLNNHRFLDAVKAFDSPNGIDCWTDFSRLSLDLAPNGEPYYFENGRETQFREHAEDIADSLRFTQKRRNGLYFA